MKVIVGTLNPVKLKAVRQVFPDTDVIGYNASHGITKWRSVEGQPCGQEQTTSGALDRMGDCRQQYGGTDYAVGIEDGLVPASELNLPATGQWYNQTIVVVSKGDYNFTIYGTPILCEFTVAEDATPAEFCVAMEHYQQLILPLMASGVDLYHHWTGTSQCRDYYIAKALALVRKAVDLKYQALEVLRTCAANGMCASAGLRYRGMLWTRDLAYMEPACRQNGLGRDVEEAWRHLCNEEKEDGQVPIVVLAPGHENEWLQARVGDWRERLLVAGQTLPAIVEDPTADYHQLASSYKEGMPGASFALRHYMEGTLAQLTPGTRDSEIHFWRTGLGCSWDEKSYQALASSLIYLHRKVIDPEDGLPQGADTRDIFAEPLYNAKLLTNVLFWRDVLVGIKERAEELEQSIVFHKTIALSANLTVALHPLRVQGKLKKWASNTLTTLETTIRKCFFDITPPRDFLPGRVVELQEPLPPFIQHLLDADPVFATGRRPDPQGMAYAVMSGLITTDEVVDWWRLSDSPIGVQVFVPISAKEGEEQHLLTLAKGFVVWPHINWVIVAAANALGTAKSIAFAREQTEKLLTHTGLAEWYVWDAERQVAVAGGSADQGWSAAKFLAY